MAHTKGPWEYGIAHNYHGFHIAPKGTLPTLAACERFGMEMTIDCFNFPGETEDNARLIAAAPELLDALKELVCCPAFTGSVFEKDEISHKAWTLSRCAIRKAMGE